MALLFHCPGEDAAAWTRDLQSRVPGLEVRTWPETGSAEEIDIAVIDHLPAGQLERFPNLRAVLALSAGVDDVTEDSRVPAGISIARIVDPEQAREMSDWVTYAVLHFHRRIDEYTELRRQGRWQSLGLVRPAQTPIGVMGLGNMGNLTARNLAALGFPVSGWSRSAKEIEGVRCFHGPDGFQPFLAASKVLVCLLPLTNATRGIINRENLAALPEGGYVISLSRGGHVVDEDLLAALDSGHITGAFLDVFNTEPLPTGHPYWTHPKVIWTPHIAGFASPAIALDQIAENIRRIRDGRPILNTINPDLGY